ncbi:hypothetical protein C9374_012511 [Naegleria lovaniensis]|uniref:Zn(2)-C6 fungal-type domain-containing protein n=1 Tax=Naegleria lovaniensis TaxID=51637 RepID=A0AA88KR02_NAELO|nr:uncharacterized protein C9374_012511 [Naegleria lovaniensis]KAG2392259.1 hypothetical protein C9374_012511 [Naegleria lovaniensis]
MLPNQLTSSSSSLDESQTLQSDSNTIISLPQQSHKACIACRKSHKRCSRNLPSCSRCQSKGLECVYEGLVSNASQQQQHNIHHHHQKPPYSSSTLVQHSRMNPIGTQTNSNPYHNVRSGNDKNTIQDNIKTVKLNTLQTYSEIICMGNPLFEMKQLEEMMFLSLDELCTNRKDILSFLLSIQALCEQRFGYTDFSEKSIARAKQILSHVYEDCDNQYVACTCVNFALYFAGEGNKQKARYYLSRVDNFISELKIYANGRIPNLQEALKVRQQHCMGSDVVLILKNFLIYKYVTDLVASQMNPLPDAKTVEETFSLLVGLSLPQEFKKTVEYNNLEDPNVLEDRIKGMEAIYNLIHISCKQGVASDFIQSIYDFVRIVVVSGLRIAFIALAKPEVSSLNVDATNNKWSILLEQSALHLSELTQSELFHFVSPLLTPFFLLAFNANLEIAKSIERGERNNHGPFPSFDEVTRIKGLNELYPIQKVLSPSVDYFQVVERDLRALRLLSTRYKYVYEFADIIEKFLKERKPASATTEYFSSESSLLGDSSSAAGALESYLGFSMDLLSTQQPSMNNTMRRTATYYSQMRKFISKLNSSFDKVVCPSGSSSSHSNNNKNSSKTDEDMIEECLQFLQDDDIELDPLLSQMLNGQEFIDYFCEQDGKVVEKI